MRAVSAGARVVHRSADEPGGPGLAGRMLRVLTEVAASARQRGRAIVESGQAQAALGEGLDSVVGWAGRRVAPRIVDTLIPYLIDAAIPSLRERVIPLVIEDLTNSRLVEELLREQSRGVVSHAAERFRNVTAGADDRVESLVGSLLHRHRER
ncbi:MAG TPA: hypothetical protein VH561_00215 [Micromonosporaceae bacterium]|jgi:hypothetical protein